MMRVLCLHDETSFDFPSEVLVHGDVLLDDIAGRGGEYTGLAVFLRLLEGDVEERFQVRVVVLLHRDGVETVGVQRLTVERQLTEGLGAAGPDDAHAM